MAKKEFLRVFPGVKKITSQFLKNQQLDIRFFVNRPKDGDDWFSPFHPPY
jgi:hypothetical protein